MSNKYTGYHTPDSTLTDYKTGINNYAAFAKFEFSPLEKLRMVASLRYDFFHYNFDNSLSRQLIAAHRIPLTSLAE